MSQGQQSSTQNSEMSKDEPSVAGRDTLRTRSDEWSEVKDPGERRKIQNKLAQRRFRKLALVRIYIQGFLTIYIGDKVKEQKEETEREVENQRRAGSSYATIEPDAMDTSQNLSGLPWGGISMKHIVETGKTKEQSSQQSSRENSVYGSNSRTGGSSR